MIRLPDYGAKVRAMRQAVAAVWREWTRPGLVLWGDGPESFTRLRTGFEPSIFLLPRSRCAFNRYRLKATGRDGVQAAVMAAARASRFAEPIILPVRATAQSAEISVWSWDRSAGAPLSGWPLRRVLPETLARQMPSEAVGEAVRLVRGLDGYEGEIWRAGELVASRWWFDTPSQADWTEFLRAGRADNPLAGVPVARPVPWKDRLIPFNTRLADYRQWLSAEKVAVAATCVLAVIACFQAGQFGRLSAETARLEARLESDAATLQRDQRSRRMAMAALITSERIAQQPSPVRELAALAALAGHLGKGELQLQSVQIVANRLEARLTGELSAGGAAIVEALEAEPALRSVTLDRPQAGQWVIRADLP